MAANYTIALLEGSELGLTESTSLHKGLHTTPQNPSRVHKGTVQDMGRESQMQLLQKTPPTHAHTV